MKKILVVSDTHGYNEALWEIIKAEEPIDMVIHCGDIETNPQVLRSRIDCTLHMVAGNNDYDPDMDRVRTFNIGPYKALLTHGHRQHIYSDFTSLYYLGMENQVDIVFFGHIHIPVIRQEGPITLINPGSLTYPRQTGRIPTYIIMTINDKNEIDYEIKYWNKKQ